MSTTESTSHSFVVKIWLERDAGEAGGAKWRGHITHVIDGKRNYFQNTNEVPLFMFPYLEAMGVKLPVHLRLRHWLRRCINLAIS
jgi:hypothetical protein